MIWKTLRLGVLSLGLTLAGAAWAGQVENSIVNQLRAQGFSRIDVTRTLLGRSRIVAESGTMRREIVVNPRTGLILRDYTTRANGAAAPTIWGGGAGGDDTGTRSGSGSNRGGGFGDDGDGDGDGDSDGDGDGDGDGGDGDGADGDGGDGDGGDGDGDGGDGDGGDGDGDGGDGDGGGDD